MTSVQQHIINRCAQIYGISVEELHLKNKAVSLQARYACTQAMVESGHRRDAISKALEITRTTIRDHHFKHVGMMHDWQYKLKYVELMSAVPLSTEMIRTYILIPESMKKQLMEQAKKEGRKFTEVMISLMARYLAETG